MFIYPVHGGFIGRDAVKLAFGSYYKYDALAPEFQTYEQIKELVKEQPIFYGSIAEAAD